MCAHSIAGALPLKLKIDQNGCCVIDIEFEHSRSLENLEATNFRDISSDYVDKIYKLFESGHTPSTGRQQNLKEIREACTNDLEFYKKEYGSVVPRRRDFDYLYTQFGNERFGRRGVTMFSKLVEKPEEYKKIVKPRQLTSCIKVIKDSLSLLLSPL